MFPNPDLCNSENLDLILKPSSGVSAVSGITALTGSAMTSVLPAKSMHRRVVITEDCSDSLIVPECRIRPGYVNLNNQIFNKTYKVDKPDKVYLAINSGKEINCPVEGAVIISSGECYVILQSRVARKTDNKSIKAFSVLCKYGVTVNHPQAVLVRQDNTDDVVTQAFRINYTNNAEFGCIVFRCANERLTYGKDVYLQHELLTIYFHRTREDYDVAPYPPVITLTHLQEQNYVPMVPGQILQIIPNLGEVEIEDYQIQGGRSMAFVNKEQLTKNGKLWVYRYECIRMSDTTQLFFVKGEQTCSIIVSPVLVDGDDLFVVVAHPYKTVKIICNNITSLRLRFAKDIPIVRWPVKMMCVPSVNSTLHELKVKFHKQLDSVNLQHEDGTCFINCTSLGYSSYAPPTQVKK